MKLIFFLAVLFISAQSSPLHELFRGFVLNLKMESHVQNKILENGLICLSSSEELLAHLALTLQGSLKTGKHFVEALGDILVSSEMIEHKIAPQCITAGRKLWAFYLKHRGGHFKSLYWKKYYEVAQLFYYSNVVQSYGRIAQDILEHRMYDAGEKLSKLFQMSNGMIEIPAPKLEREEYTGPFHRERFIQGVFTGFLGDFGASQQQVDGVIYCFSDFFNTTDRVFSPYNQERGNAFLERAMLITESLDRCSEKVDFSPLSSIMEPLVRNPVPSILRILQNSVLDNSELMQHFANFNILGKSKKNELAGQTLAKFVRLILKGVANL